MALHRPAVQVSSRVLTSASYRERVFLRPAGQPDDPARPYGLYQPKDREYKVARDGSHDTGLRLSSVSAT